MQIIIPEAGCGDKTLLTYPVLHKRLKDKIFQFHIQHKAVIAERTAGKDFNIRLLQFLPAAGTKQEAFISAPLNIIEHPEIIIFCCIR